MSRFFYTAILVLLPLWAFSQISNLRSKTLPVLSSPQLLDSLTVIPQSLTVTNPKTGERISPQNYTIENNRIQFDSSFSTLHSSFAIKYRVLPFDLAAPYARLDSSIFIRDPANRLIGTPYDPYAEEGRPLLPQKGLDYNGNYTRGLSFGNNQNLVLNSQFNLQMAGTLGDLEVLAAITDNNIPVQPEGNTQQLREFDRIFVQISKNENVLIAGDYELTRPESYFMNYFKKLQGATFSREWNFANNPQLKKLNTTLNTKASVAVARGKFARNTLAAQEGNQGPYRLEGAEGERFLIVLAGTEKVFLDGKLMQRGQDLDYVIDYNAAQITFMPRRLITKDSRIVVEFDYSVQDYQRSLYAFDSEWRNKKWRAYLHTYSEQDSRQPIDDDFTEFESLALRNAGDLAVDAVVSSIDTVEEFSAFRVLYELRDTTVDGSFYPEVLVFSADPVNAKYTASFALVGLGQGNYVLDTESAANGRVFRWVAPDPVTGELTGEYEPVRRLVAPNRQQLYTAGAEFFPSKNTNIRAEVALSNRDLNRLSPIDDDDNLGGAGTFGLKHTFELFGKKANQNSKVKNQRNEVKPRQESQGVKRQNWLLETSANYEFAQKQFKELNPYRPAEFTRDWNLNRGVNDVAITERSSDEHLANAGFRLRSPKAGSLEYQFGTFLRDTFYTGTKHFTKYNFVKNGLEIWAQADLLTTDASVETSEFSRPKFNVAIPFFRDSTGAKYWRAGVYGEREKNSRFTKISNGMDTLNAASFYYDVVKFFVEMPESERFNAKASLRRRIDHAPVVSEFATSTTADEFNILGAWRQSRNSRLTWDFTYRKLVIDNSELTNLDPTETYLGRADYSLNFLRGVAQLNTSYQLGSGQERKIEITYLQVPAGEGTHQWTDRNEDGKVQVDEVEIAPFQDVANAVRVSTFTDEFIRTNDVTFNQSIRLEPKAVWFNAKGIRKILAKFSTQSSLQITRKVRDVDEVSAWNPFELDVADTALVSSRSAIYNTLFFNRANPKFDLQLGMSDNQNKLVQTTGFESRRQREQFLKMRWNVTRSLSFQNSVTLGNDEQGSEQFESRRYRIRSVEAQPQLTFQPSNSFRTSFTYRFESAENELGTEGENAKTNDLKFETVYNRSSTTSIRSEFSLVDINFSGDANSPVGFAFLRGLQNGKNYLWNLTLDRQVAKNIRIGITYEGRKTGIARVVHVGRAQVGMVF